MQIGYLVSVFKSILFVFRGHSQVGVSIFTTTAAHFKDRLKMRFSLVIISLLFSASAFAQNSEIQRQALFVRAFESASFILYMASQDKTFMQSLTKDEFAMMSAIYDHTSGNRAEHWLQKNHIPKLAANPKPNYAYVIYEGQIADWYTATANPAKLRFSNDQSLFTLKPNEPVRTAMTKDDIEDDILVNLVKINDPNTSLDFASAFSLIVHEFGHKLKEKKIQSAVDSAAAKLETYIRSITNVTEIGGKKVSVLKFYQFPWVEWIEYIFFGEIVGVNRPKRHDPLNVFDGQGTYVWIEDEHKITDLTGDILSKYQTKLKAPNSSNGLMFVNNKMLLSANVNVSQAENGDIKLSVSATLTEALIPYLTHNQPNQAALLQAFTRDSYIHSVSSQDFQIGKSDSKVRSVVQPLINEKPEYKIEFIEKRVKGNDLEIFYSIKGPRKISLDQYTENSELWPELVIQIEKSKIKLKASNYYEDSDEFKFTLKDFPALANKSVSVVGLNLRLKTPNFAAKNSDIILKTFLPFESTLNKATSPASAPISKKDKPFVKSMQLWSEAKGWITLTNKNKISEGTLLRLVLRSDEPIRELILVQQYTVTNGRQVEFFGQKTAPYIVTDERTAQIQFNQDDLRQTQYGRDLFVDVNIDKNILKQLSIRFPMMIDNGNGSPLVESGTYELEDIKVENLRKLLSISFTTRSGLSNQFLLKNELPLQKLGHQEPPDERSLPSKQMSCERLF